MRTNRVVAAACLLLALPTLSGCGLVFGGSRQVVRLTSSPDGAKVVTNPVTADSTTPSSISLERKNNYTLTFSAPGYTSKNVELQKGIRGGIVVLDILFGLVPVIIDAATGGWYGLSPDLVSVTLTKTSADVVGPDQIQIEVSLKNSKYATEVRPKASSPGVTVSVQYR